MKPAAQLKHVLPRRATGARRKLSTSTVGSLTNQQPTPIYFDGPSTSSSPSPSAPSNGSGPSSPRLLKLHTGSPTTAITTYSPPASNPSQNSSLIAHPRYTTNSSQSYPGSNLPLVWLVPPSGKNKSEIERWLPWEGASEGKAKDAGGYRLEMGAYGIPKRRRQRDDHDEHDCSRQSSLAATSSKSTPSSTTAPSPPSLKEDPSWYNLAVQVGEDAYFLRPDALGVADGVGGWRHKGESHSALFAKKLMHFCSWELAQLQAKSPRSYPSPPSSHGGSPAPPSLSHLSFTPKSPSPSPTAADPDPIKILQNSYDRCVHEARESGLLGSSTATLAVLANSELRIAHLGDCVVCVVRDGEIAFRSEEMQHSFNYPYQLGPKSTTTPIAHAQRFNIPVKPNDIVILASDGMGDNLWDEDVLDEIQRFIRQQPSTSSSATELSMATSSTSSAGPTASASPPLRHATGGRVTNTVLAQRLSEALASRAKRVSERKAMTADASGSVGVFAPKKSLKPEALKPVAHEHSHAQNGRNSSTDNAPPPSAHTVIAASHPARPEVAQTPTPPPTPLLKPAPATPQIEGMQMPVHSQIIRSDGQIDDVVGDGFGGDGEYGGSGYGFGQSLWGEEGEEEEWVRDEIPFSRRAREAGVRFVGGKGDDISVLVAIISGPPEASPVS
ncbi:hypothetical protein FRB99_005325 [Tulasnella sp. 403]|nr:hypothetical protein FRB99_005325 [Tulasnella sp. 403]